MVFSLLSRVLKNEVKWADLPKTRRFDANIAGIMNICAQQLSKSRPFLHKNSAQVEGEIVFQHHVRLIDRSPIYRKPDWPTEALRLLGFVAFTNLPFWILGTHFLVLRPIVNVDIFIAIFATMLSPVVGLLVLASCMVLDIVQSMSLVYHFHAPLEMYRSIRFAQALNWRDFITGNLLGVVTCFCVAMSLAWGLLRSWRPSARAALVALILLTALDLLNGSALPVWLGKDSFRIPANVSGSPSYNLVAQVMSERTHSSMPIKKWADDGAVNPVTWAQRTRGNVLIVLVESMGTLHDQALADWLRSQLITDSITSRWEASSDTRGGPVL